mgnify:CR=1 FL=1
MFEKILTVLSKNLGYSVVLAVALLLFAVFSDGLIAGLITAVSALLAYTCFMALYVAGSPYMADIEGVNQYKV